MGNKFGDLVDEQEAEKQLGKMSEVFEGYERQYCELSANLSKKCTTAGALDGGDYPGFALSFVSIAYDFNGFLA